MTRIIILLTFTTDLLFLLFVVLCCLLGSWKWVVFVCCCCWSHGCTDHTSTRTQHATRREETQDNNPPLKRFEFAYDTAGVRGLRTQQQEQEDDYLIFVLEELGS